MSIVLVGSTSGSVTLQEPAVAGTTVLDLPAVSGTVLTSASTITPSDGSVTQAKLAAGVAGNGPTFSAYQGSSQTLSSATFTKITLDTEEWDTNNNFASSRFTPTVAGYYQVNAAISNNTGTQTVAYIYKNGGQYKQGINTTSFSATASALVYLNGSTDYVEFFGYFASSTTTNTGVNTTYFQGVLVRAG